jgi:hypothetical protein
MYKSVAVSVAAGVDHEVSRSPVFAAQDDNPLGCTQIPQPFSGVVLNEANV